MHVLQWVVVEADDVEDSVSVADAMLENAMGHEDSPSSWYDWYVVGGGRWNIADEEDWKSGYDTKTNMIISFEDNPNAFNAKIQELIQNRIDTYNEYHKEIEGKDVMAMFDNYGGVMSYSHETYPLRNLLRFLDGDWFYDSKFYDLVHWSTNATHILSKIDKGLGENLFLVPIDFHF
jgi:hypothetical protein